MDGQQIYWEKIFDENCEDLLNHRWSKAQWFCFSKYIPRGSKVLEIGCGTGRIIAQASRYLAVDGYGIDYQFPMVLACRSLAKFLGPENCSPICGSGFNLPFADDSFDVVLSEGVIEHFPPHSTELMISEHVRVCKSGGLVLISVPNLWNLPLTYVKWRMQTSYPAFPERSYTQRGLRRLIEHYGVKIIKIDGFAPSIAFEWFIHPKIKLEWFDRLIAKIPSLAGLMGYEFLAIGIKK